MNLSKNTILIHAGLVMLFLGLLFWQIIEHRQVSARLRSSLVNRSRDISSSLGVVMRSQRRFGGLVSRPRLESALTDLVGTEELRAVALVNQFGEVVASAGEVGEISLETLPAESAKWEGDKVTFFNLVDLGSTSTNENSRPDVAIVVDRSEDDAQRERERRRRDEGRRRERPPDLESSPDSGSSPDREESRRSFFRRERPPWLSEEEYESMKARQGVHGFLVEMSTVGVQAAIDQDRWLRTIVVSFGSLALVAAAFARRGTQRSTEFELRFLRAREQNVHLRDMNLAAAGLAHETRNPLNLIRGTAQMISKQEGVPAEVRAKCTEIAGEVDRVTGQLNEFINYSRPREVRRTPVELGEVIDDVLRTLKGELEDQKITVVWARGSNVIQADEKLLRQIIFNLCINAMQALDHGGTITVEERREGPELILEVKDDGPGVEPELEVQIFQPYFTTRTKGTGLGLAIVRQIGLAHGWEIEYFPNSPKGAGFRISRIETANPG